MDGRRVGRRRASPHVGAERVAISAYRSAVQEGIYFQPGTSPPAFFTLVALRKTDGADAESVRKLLAKLWELYAGLRTGRVPDLHDVPGGNQAALVPSGNLVALIGFGVRAFDLNRRAQSGVAKALRTNRFQKAEAGHSIALGDDGMPSGIVYGQKADLTDLTDVEFVVQFTADTPLAVERAVVETWKALYDERDPALEIAGVFAGSQRDDARSWIDFHDGLSNLSRHERRQVIPIRARNGDAVASWTINGTYLGFIRLGISLGVWRNLAPEKQERLVGRTKLTGCPLVRFDGNRAVVAPGCPVAEPITDRRNVHFWDAPEATDDIVIEKTHIRRTNQRERLNKLDPLSKIPAWDKESHRIFRQGYPYLDSLPKYPYFQVGLNFVSFQNAPERLMGMLTRDTWLGGTNFGGKDSNDPEVNEKGEREPPVVLMTAYAAGMFFVPPRRDDKSFPGCRILGG